jgi:predicted dehydrogenase
MSLRVGMVGVGAFAQCFIPLFKAHPLVSEIVLCDLDAKKLRENADRYGIKQTSSSLDDLLARGSDGGVDAVAIITQHWLHAPQAIAALRAGKHVYSAVPTGVTMEEIRSLVRAVEETNRVYMIGETSYYYPAMVYCRKRFAERAFGHIVYGEAEYYHDWDHGLEDVYKWRYGPRWRELGGDPPMHYPTHSTSAIISVTGARMTKVSCFGYVDREPNTIWNPNVNQHGNAFSNESALFQMSDGSIARINEFRRVGHPGTVRLNLFGTQGSFEENVHGPVWVTTDHAQTKQLDELLAPNGVLVREVVGGMEKITSQDGTHVEAAPIHDLARLPKEFIGLPNGHNGSHQFLVDDFVRACVENHLPPNNVWDAARYAIPGIIAHDSALRGGELMDVPDLGGASQDQLNGTS